MFQAVRLRPSGGFRHSHGRGSGAGWAPPVTAAPVHGADAPEPAWLWLPTLQEGVVVKSKTKVKIIVSLKSQGNSGINFSERILN